MNLFINAISKNSYLALFNDKREILKDKFFSVKGNESSLFVPIIDQFLKENNLNYFDLNNIVCVNGPGSFTGIRTIVLAVNTISFVVKNIKLTPVSYFSLFNSYPIIKSSSKRDSFFKKDENSPIEIIYNEELEKTLQTENIQIVYGEGDLKNTKIIEKIDYCSIIRNVEFKNFTKIEALYIKKPNIC